MAGGLLAYFGGTAIISTSTIYGAAANGALWGGIEYGVLGGIMEIGSGGLVPDMTLEGLASSVVFGGIIGGGGKYLIDPIAGVADNIGTFVGDTFTGAKKLLLDESGAIDVTRLYDGMEWIVAKFTGWGPFGRGIAPRGLPKGFDPTKGFASFDDFKKAFGEAGSGQAWHHIVEQTINSGKFAPEILHNPANLLKLPHGKGSIHAKISGYYSSKIPGLTGNKTVREWLSTKSFQEQFDFGIDVIKQFGGSQYLPPHLR